MFNNFNFNEINDLGRSLEDLYISDLNENNDNEINELNLNVEKDMNYMMDSVILTCMKLI